MLKKSIIILVIILALLVLSLKIGLFSSYNYFTAKRDIHYNKYVIILIDPDFFIFNEEQKIADKFNYQLVKVKIQDVNYYGVKAYNSVMLKAIVNNMDSLEALQYKNENDSLQKKILKYYYVNGKCINM